MRAFILILVAAGCTPELGHETAGELGRMSFYYSSGTGCFFGCGLDRPLMRGTRELLFAEGTSALRTASFSVDPLDPVRVSDGAFSFEDRGRVSRAFDVSAAVAGDAALSLLDEHGNVIDRVMLRIRDAARLTAAWAPYNPNHGPSESGWSASSVVQLSGNDVDVDISAFDDAGRRLQAASGVAVSVSDPRIVAVMSSEPGASWLVLHPLSRGHATLMATAKSGASTQLDVIVQ
jgi:hypothetical protein